MSELGDFLERVMSAQAPFQSVQATIHEWCDESISLGGVSGLSIGRPRTGAASNPSRKEIRQRQFRAWIRYPDRARVECSMVGPKGAFSTLFILVGDAWQYCGPGQEIEEGKLHKEFGRGIMPLGFEPVEGLLDQEQIRTCLPELKLRQAETSVFAGRRCVRILAEVVEGAHRHPFHFPFNMANRYEFLADPERGLFLRKAAFLGDKLIGFREIQEIDFDVELDDSLFVLPQEQAVNLPSEKRRRRGEMTLEQAIAAAPFSILLPPDWPEPSYVFFKRPDEQADTEFVHVMWDGEHHTSMELMRQAIPEMKEFEWEEISTGDRMIRLSDPQIDMGMKILFMEFAGTFAMITSTMPRQELLKFAASLLPVKKELAS